MESKKALVVFDFNNIVDSVIRFDLGLTFWRHVIQLCFSEFRECEEIMIKVLGSYTNKNEAGLKMHWLKIQDIFERPNAYLLDWHNAYVQFDMGSPVPQYTEEIDCRAYNRDDEIIKFSKEFLEENRDFNLYGLFSGDGDFLPLIKSIKAKFKTDVSVFGFSSNKTSSLYAKNKINTIYIKDRLPELEKDYNNAQDTIANWQLYQKAFFNPANFWPDRSKFLMFTG